MIKKLLLALALSVTVVTQALAAGGGVAWDKAPNRTNDMAALQNGAKIFANYCLNCHAASYMRFNRLQDIGLTDKQIKENLNFISDKTGDLMQITMDPVEAKKWFGATPPDLSVIARSRAGSNGISRPEFKPMNPRITRIKNQIEINSQAIQPGHRNSNHSGVVTT